MSINENGQGHRQIRTEEQVRALQQEVSRLRDEMDRRKRLETHFGGAIIAGLLGWLWHLWNLLHANR